MKLRILTYSLLSFLLVSSPLALAQTSDTLHISYSNYDSQEEVSELNYATNSSGNIATQNIDYTVRRNRIKNDLTKDASGALHVAYADEYSLRYGYQINEVWQTEILDEGEYYNPSVALYRNQKVYISYYDQETQPGAGQLAYAYKTIGASDWAIHQPIAPAYTAGLSTGAYSGQSTIFVDGYETLHVVYTYKVDEDQNYEIRYAKKAKSENAWSITTVDAGTLDLKNTTPQIHVAPNGSKHIVYILNGDVKYAYASNTATSFTTKVIENLNSASAVSMVMKESSFNVSYIDQDTNVVKYAKRAYLSAPTTDWTIETAILSVYSSSNTSIDLKNGNIYISYTDPYFSLNYGSKLYGQSSWTATLVDSDSGEYSSLVVQ